MKRIFTLVVLLTALTMGISAQGVKFGVKGGLNITKLSFDESVFDANNKTGFFIGPTMQVGLIGGLGLDIAAMYDQKKTEINEETVKQQSIIIPVNARMKIGLGKMAGIYLAAGPQFAFNVGDDEFKWTKSSSYNTTFQLKKSNLSVNLGAGAYLFNHLEIGFAYNIGVSKTGEAGWTDFRDTALKPSDAEETKAKTWTISAAYYF